MRFAYLIEPPFNFRDAEGDVLGHDVEIAREVCRALDLIFEPVETEFAQLLPGLTDGRWEMTTGLFATAERRKVAAFTHPVWALPDGLLVSRGNPLALSGYRSVADRTDAILAVIRDQYQHRSALDYGIPGARLRIFDRYAEAAEAVLDGRAHAYASVGRAHVGYIAQHPDLQVDVVEVPLPEKPPEVGAFGLALQAKDLLSAVNSVLDAFLGSERHRRLAERYGFSRAEIDLVARRPTG